MSKDVVRCDDLAPEPGGHCSSCHEDEEFDGGGKYPLGTVLLKDGRQAVVCCRVAEELREEGVLA